MAEAAASHQVLPEDPPSSSSIFSFLVLQRTVEAISEAAITGTFDELTEQIVSLVRFLDRLSDFFRFDPAFDEMTYSTIFELLSHVQRYICHPSLDKRALNALSTHLPKTMTKFAGLSKDCSMIVQSVCAKFAEKCNSVDMIISFCEALIFFGTDEDALGYAPPLLHGLSIVFSSIRSSHFRVVQAALPSILNAVKVASSDFYNRPDTLDTFEKAIGLATSIQAICEKEGKSKLKERLRALLGLFVLQIMALVSISMWNETDCIDLVLQLLHFFPYCGFSYMGLLTGRVVITMSALFVEREEGSGDCMDKFSYVKHGAILSVLWGHISDQAAQAIKDDISMVKHNMKSMETKRWEAVRMLTYMFSDELPWYWKEHAINFLLVILDSVDRSQINQHIVCSVQIPTLKPSLKAMMRVMHHGPNATVRQNAIKALKLVLADIPGSFRFHLLLDLIKNSSTSSYATSFLIECGREFLVSDYRKKEPDREVKEKECSSFVWSADVLQLVEVVLSPPGGKPSLPEQFVAVTSALCLYRYLIATESAGETNYTGVLSKSNLMKAYNEWLLPLESLICLYSDELSEADTVARDSLLFVLNVNIELVKEELKRL